MESILTLQEKNGGINYLNAMEDTRAVLVLQGPLWKVELSPEHFKSLLPTIAQHATHANLEVREGRLDQSLRTIVVHLPEIHGIHRDLIASVINSLLWESETEAFAMERLKEIDKFYRERTEPIASMNK